MATATQSNLQAKTISPSLTVNDLQQSVKFFEGLGFAVEDRWEEQGKLLGVTLRAGDASIGEPTTEEGATGRKASGCAF